MEPGLPALGVDSLPTELWGKPEEKNILNLTQTKAVLVILKNALKHGKKQTKWVESKSLSGLIQIINF